MNVERQRIVDDLAGLLEGELRCDPLSVAMYASDGSLYQVPPLGVVFPKHRDDVVTIAKYCAERQIPLIGRGAGSGVAGESLGNGLLVDFTRYMRRVIDIGDDTIRVQPGMVLQRLNRILRPFERYFPPDPSRSDVTTLGSMLAIDAAGSHSVRVGSTRDHVESLEVVLAGGHCVEFTQEPLSQLAEWTPGESPDNPAMLKRDLVGQLTQLLRSNADLIRQHQPPLIRNRAGYYLRNLLSDKYLLMPRLLVGSEGTLGLFTEATLHTAPLPAHRGLVLLLFSRLETATKAVQSIMQLEPSACDLLDRRLLSLAREADPRFEHIIAPAAEAGLIVEQIGFSEEQSQSRIRQVIRALQDLSPAPVVAHCAFSFEEVEFLWSLPHKVVPLLAKMQGTTRPVPFVEDVAVPPQQLHEFLVAAQNIFKTHQVTASLYAHAAAGQIHLRPFLPPPGPKDGPRIEQIAHDIFQAALAAGGTISGEHGSGLARTAFLPDQYGPLYPVFRQVKQIFDPQNLINPGKVINNDPHLTSKNLRPTLPANLHTVDLQLKWQPGELSAAATRCNGCGSCRTQDPQLRMCPMFRLELSEEASPRAKANLLRGILAGHLQPDDLASAEMKRVANLCFNCKQCQLECPSTVNIPQMMIEAKASYVAAHGLTRAEWYLSRAHLLGNVAMMFPAAANGLLGNSVSRWMLEKVFGVARQRKLPRFAKRSFLSLARKELLTRPVRWNEQTAVVYFVDQYVNHHDPQLGQALVQVLRHHGIPVYVPPGQVPSGMSLIAAGDLQAARKLALQNIKVLADFAREGIPIICTEPSAALALQQEYPRLLDHPDVETIANGVIEAGAYLHQLQQAGKFRTDFQKVDAQLGYHEPCHLRSLGRGTPLAHLLEEVPGFEVQTIDHGCSGMAGTYGLIAENYRDSMRIGWGLISRMRQEGLTVGVTECSSCKFQMEQGTPRPTLHPLKLLAWAYGLLPQLPKTWESPRKDRFVS